MQYMYSTSMCAASTNDTVFAAVTCDVTDEPQHASCVHNAMYSYSSTVLEYSSTRVLESLMEFFFFFFSNGVSTVNEHTIIYSTSTGKSS